jgi:hypothetical protein
MINLGYSGIVGLAQLVKFSVMELIIHLGSNHDSDVFFMTDLVNLKIKSVKYFECVYRNMMYMRMFIGVNAHTYMSIYVCIMFLTKNWAIATTIYGHPKSFNIPQM